MKIGLIQNDSPYDIQAFLFEEMKEILESEHHEVEIIPLKYSFEDDEFEDIMLTSVTAGNFDLMFTMDLTGFERRLMEDECFYNNMYCPMIHLLTKDAWYYSRYLGQRLNFSMFFYIENQYNARYITDTFRHFPNIDTLPTVGFQKYGKCWDDRTIDVYVPSAYEKPDSIMAQVNTMPSVFKSITLHLIEAMKQQKALSFYDAVMDYFRELKFEVTKEELVDIMSEVSVATRYIKMYAIDACVRELVDAGVRVTVSGKGWENYVGTDGKAPQILGENGISYRQMLQTMGDAKIVLHNQSHKSEDVSERVVNGLLQGAVVLSDRVYQDESIKKEVVTYDINHLDRLPMMVTEILQSKPQGSTLNAEDYSLRPAVLKMVANCFS